MKNVALDGCAALQLHAHGADRAFDTAAHDDVLRDDAALDLRAFADQEIGSAQFALDSTIDLGRTVAFDIAMNGHAAADARNHVRAHGGMRHRWLWRKRLRGIRTFRRQHRTPDRICDRIPLVDTKFFGRTLFDL